MITYEDWLNIDLRVGTITEAAPHPNADKLVVLKVNLGDETRQIVAGIKKHYGCEKLINMQIIVLVNLEPREVRGVMSSGMLLAAVGGCVLSLITTETGVSPGTKVG